MQNSYKKKLLGYDVHIYIYIYMCVCVCVCVCCSSWSLLYPLFERLEEIIYLSTAAAYFTTWNRRLKRHDKICVLACSGIAFVVIKSTNPFQELGGFSSRRPVSIQEQFTCHFCGGIRTFIDTDFSSSTSGFSPSLSTRRSSMR